MLEEKSFGKLIREAREQLGWTQTQLADKFDSVVSRITVGRWEKGEQRPTVQNFEELISILNLNEQEAYALYYAGGKTPERQNLPLSNHFFTGREAYLEKLRELLEKHRVVALSGLGGIGKTQIALKFAYQHHPDIYPTVLWVNAANTAMLEADFASLTKTLKLPQKDEPELEPRIEAVKEWLEEHTDWLLVIDNADELELARSFFPAGQRGHILLTTRSQIVGILARRVGIERMEPSEGLLFLLRRSGILQVGTALDTVDVDTREIALRVVKLLGGHPLALDQAGAYIDETGESFANYIRLYRKGRRDLLDRRGSSAGSKEHPETVAATVELCFRKVCEQQPMAADVLYFCLFYEPDNIPVFDLIYFLELDTKLLNEVIAVLRRYSLITQYTQRVLGIPVRLLSMHRLVQAVLIETLSPELQIKWQNFFKQVEWDRMTDFGYGLAGLFYEWYEDDASEELAKVVTILTPTPASEGSD